ncbi:amino acid adenylation domain-containing protein [Calothrix sp. FACHB-1219]|uniref:non-ribosomal peptide synthetase n=1 Tax=unclassified Calothrix TaxID=2619626 RepID=UPI00168660F5|nr:MULTISPECIES: non-ribosomal peptide synthetase [unclassified Calothrix]MBD2202784.1 amino acid adenylation domain-containing protein [Calothrix sp. FACHB-168]MBD2218937.1 amino acid adenylation domain-containing protein [Calothrix sp. FACHB-1219]
MMNYSDINDIELLELLLEADGIKQDTEQFLIPRRSLQEAPLSFQQRRLWFLYELEPTSSAYNICSVFSLQGLLNVEALQQAFRELQQRHESLRTTFTNIDGEARQIIHPNYLTEISLEDWSDACGDQRYRSLTETEPEISHIGRSEADYTFDLATGPLIRARLFRLTPQRYILTLTLHHIIADAWSIGVILQELAILYQLAIRGDKTGIAELKIQYADYAVWQQEKFNPLTLANSLNYWEKQLSELPVLQFPIDFSRPRLQTFRGDLVKFELPNSLSKNLRTFSQKSGATLFMTLMAGFQALLSRYTGQEDIPVGTSIANRPGFDAEKLIGFFVNMLVIRTDLSDAPSFRTLVNRVRTTVLEAFEHTEVPFETLVERLNIERDTSRNPLFQIAFTLLNAPKPNFGIDDLEISILANQEAARFDLELFITESADSLHGVFSYNIDLFKRETVERFARHFCQLLESLVTQPDTPVSRLSFLLPEELAPLVPVQPQQTFSVTSCLHEVFSQQVKSRPQQTALIFEKTNLTYEQLNHRANQLAHHLINLGVKPESRVGLWLSRSLDLLVAILAILKAGGVYVPFDPDYPSDRIAYMLEDSQVAVLLTHSQFQAQIPPHQATTIFIDNCEVELATQPTTAPEVLVHPDNAAYIIYTSGSTGKPKGVVVTHRHVVRLMLATEKWFKFNPKDIWTLFHSCAFDFSVWEIWGALFFGGTLIIVPYLVSRSPEEFYNLLCDRKVTVLNQTPSAFRQLMQAEASLGREGELELRYVIFGGEALDLASLEPWFERHDEEFPLLVNMYGITETTVHVTYRPIRLRDVKQRRGSLIGKPIPDLSLYILDRHCQPVPIGVVGEMYVGGAGVTRGYFHRPQLTAERMIPNPFNHTKLERLYKTGDLARFLDNGEIEYIGRNDHQVKIRGFRIELGEIAAVIKRHPGVKDVLVIVRETSQEDMRIAAYIVAKNQVCQQDLTKEQTQEWQYTFNETYQGGDTETDPAFNIVGWNSSYDNQPIPAVQMRQWLDNTLERIQALQPQRVLEIGCGTGMILLNIAPQVEAYWGTDFSQAAINRLTNILQNQSLSHVRLFSREAINFADIPTAYFDTIIINSVAQYFPSLEYLQQVIAGALQLLAPGGSLFIGDNRSLPLLNYFHSSIGLFQAADNIDRENFKIQVNRLAAAESELVIDPSFFVNLTQAFPDVAAVEVHLKAENNHNELTKYRYDAILHKSGAEQGDIVEAVWQDWETANLHLDDLRDKISAVGAIGWRGIPNARLIKDAAIWQWLQGNNSNISSQNIGELREFIHQLDLASAIDPVDLYTLAQAIGCEVTISYSPDLNHEYFDVCFYPKTNDKRRSPVMPISHKIGHQVANYYAINPLKARLAKTLISQLKAQAREELPEYMRPASFVLLESFPLTPSGKLDRRALPAPDREQEITRESFVQPTTPTQTKLCHIWSDVLGIEQIGIADDFFHLGGHSLLATKLVSRIREEFNLALPLRTVFEYSTIAGLATEIERLAENTNISNAALDIIPQISDRQNFPLSFSQSRLWFLDLLEPNNPAYNIAVAFRLDGKLNRPALQQSLQTIIQRHEVLRTTFESVDGVPIQVIHPAYSVPLIVTELQPTEQLQELISQAITTPFNLRSLPLLRVHLYQLAADVHVFVLVIHHIIADGWSLGLMIEELSLSYTAFCRQETAKLQPLPIQYADFAHWQRTTFEQTQLPAQLAYWKQKLTGKIEVLELPTDYPRPAIARYQGSAVSFTINRETSTALQKLCESQGATLFMGLLGVFSTLLMRYSGKTDLLIGTPIANRNRKQVESLIGFFVNTLVINTNLSGNPDFINLLLRIKEETLEAYAYQDVPFERIVEEIQPERNLSHHPLFQVMFVLQNAPMGKLELPDLQLTPWETEQVTAKFDLTLLMTETEQGIQGQWEYRSDLFEVTTIKRMVGHFQTLLEAIVANPQQCITALPLLTSTEQNQLLVNWQNNQVDYPQDISLHQLFEIQVKKTPDAIAVLFENQYLTYDELNQRANQLANYLQNLGVKPEVVVGICLERSLEMVVGLLGILKAGGAYLPIDSAYPQERINFMLADGQISILLTQEQLLAKLNLQNHAQMICLDRDWEIIAQQSIDNPVSGTIADNLAYIIYTSGSTGKPKGVMINHRAICNHMLWMQTTFAFQETDIVIQKTPFSFDASIWEFYAPLLVGGKLIIAKPGGHQDVSYLLEVINQQQVTIVQLVPSLLQMLLEQEGIEKCNSLKHIFCGGETLSLVLQKKLLSRLNVNLYNLYGPTEACIDATFWTCQAEINQKNVPIGRAIHNTKTYILDSNLQPVPIGIPGELHIGGAGLARGYFNRPELTADKFIANPFNSVKSERLYKTGDLVRYLPDGNIEFLGRIDNQVKIRGFRIELGEIEEILNQHTDVVNAVLITNVDAVGSQNLVAYIVPATEQLTSVNQLRTFLKEKLPDYMVPANFVIIDSLPLTPNGKVDRKALASLNLKTNIPANNQILPRTPLEYKLVEIWEEILQVNPIGVTENFFDLGGHSLLAIRLIAAIENRLDCNLPVVALFREGTIEKIAALIEQERTTSDLDVLVPLQTKGNLPPLFLMHQAGGYALSYSLLAQTLGQERPVYGLQAHGLDGKQPPLATVEAMAASYIKAIRAIQPSGPYLLGGHSLGGLIAFEITSQLEAMGEQVENLLIIDTHPPLPTLEIETSLEDDAAILCFIVEQIAIHFNTNINISYEELSSRNQAEQFQYVLQILQQSELVPPDSGVNLITGLINVYKANVQASLRYQPQTIKTAISLFKTASLAEQFPDDPTVGWANLTQEQVSVCSLPGEHQTILKNPHLQKLAAEITAVLSRLRC